MTARLRAVVRGTISLALFAAFALGSLVVSPLMLVLRRPERCQPVIRATWRLLVKLFVLTRLTRIDRGNLTDVRGSVIVANHPSLIDVVLLLVLVPRTLYVAKHALKANPFVTAIVRATALPDDARLPEAAAPYLKKGWNVLVFPEGTRTPASGVLNPFRRGAAQVAVRTGAPVACVRIDVSHRVLGKRQAPWDVGSSPVTYAFRLTSIPARPPQTGVTRAAAVRLTEEMRRKLSATSPRAQGG